MMRRLFLLTHSEESSYEPEYQCKYESRNESTHWESIDEISCEHDHETRDEKWYKSEREEIEWCCHDTSESSYKEIHDRKYDTDDKCCPVGIDIYSRNDIWCEYDRESRDQKFDKKCHNEEVKKIKLYSTEIFIKKTYIKNLPYKILYQKNGILQASKE